MRHDRSQRSEKGVSPMRTQILGRFAAPEMIALGLVEMMLTFTLTLVLLTPVSGTVSFSSIHPAIISASTVGFIAFVIGLYRPQVFMQARTLLFNTLLSALLSFPAVWIMSKAFGLSEFWPVGYDPFRPIKIVAIWSASVICIRLAFLLATRFNLFVHRVAIVCSDDVALTGAAARASRRGFLELTVVRPEMASATRLKADRVRTLIFAGGAEDTIVPAIREEYRRSGITIRNQAEFWERGLRRIDILNLDPDWIAQLDVVPRSRAIAVFTRVFDICASVGLLLTTLPLMGVVAVLVWADSPGPVLYRQERVGLHNRPFTLLKFRSMRSNAEASGPKWAQQKDPRVTRVGSFMRKTRIDELPQLLNILNGEMSFIGPRPERPHFVRQLCEVIPSYSERSRVKPGLTGWAQVNFPYGASVEDARAKLSYDLYYVKNRTLVLDLLILLSTVRVILLQEGAR